MLDQSLEMESPANSTSSDASARMSVTRRTCLLNHRQPFRFFLRWQIASLNLIDGRWRTP